uniref:Uncharacterized protein n=1 Tax=viral metagenome TaxID=1070528 RepID=A0A6C0H7B6_9ZZZZ
MEQINNIINKFNTVNNDINKISEIANYYINNGQVTNEDTLCNVTQIINDLKNNLDALNNDYYIFKTIIDVLNIKNEIIDELFNKIKDINIYATDIITQFNPLFE